MRKNTKGFTLIELLIVIAIIGILAAVLIPNLMAARVTAAQRAAQAHSSNVYTAGVAALAEDMSSNAGDIGPALCVDGAAITAKTVATSYSFNDAPASTTCTIAANASETDLIVTVVYGTVGDSTSRTYVNGQQTVP